MRWILPFCLIVLTVNTGCTSKKATPGPERQTADKGGHERPEFVMQKAAAGPVDEKQPPAPEQKGKIAQPRKIRYTADVRLIVEDFGKAEEALDAAIKDANADLANSETNNSANAVRSGTWRVRVPVDQFHAFRKAVVRLGEIEKNAVDSEDMTDKYYDLDAHIKNRSAARDAMRDLLKETGKRDMEQYLKVYDKLENINDEINRKEGQLRLWANLTDLTTVTIHLRERQKYIAEKGPEPIETPTFGMRAGKTWAGSGELFLGFCQSLILVVIAAIPWLPIPLTAILGGWLVARRVLWVMKRPALAVAGESAKTMT